MLIKISNGEYMSSFYTVIPNVLILNVLIYSSTVLSTNSPNISLFLVNIS